MNIDSKHYEIIKNILKKYPYTFYMFGSRAKGGITKKFSDLDLCFFENIPGNILAHIDEDFEESDLPYKVDIVAWNKCDLEFKKIIKDDLICIQQGSNSIDLVKLLNLENLY